jgi:hypothetical protein
MFFAMFLPLADVFSVDAALSQKKQKGRRRDYLVWNVATLAMMLQILAMYYSAHYLKTGREWRELGNFFSLCT